MKQRKVLGILKAGEFEWPRSISLGFKSIQELRLTAMTKAINWKVDEGPGYLASRKKQTNKQTRFSGLRERELGRRDLRLW